MCGARGLLTYGGVFPMSRGSLIIDSVRAIGMLSRVSVILTRNNYRIMRQSQTPVDDKLQQINFELNGDQWPVPDAIIDELRNVDSALVVVSNGSTRESVAKAAQQSDTLDLEDLYQVWPNITPWIATRVAKWSDEEKNKNLFELGAAMGRRKFADEYSLGAPMDLKSALKRMLIPAVKPFAKARAEGSDAISLDSNLFCKERKPHYCELTRGFLEGFLADGELTQGVRVRQSACKCKGDAGCSYKFSTS